MNRIKPLITSNLFGIVDTEIFIVAFILIMISAYFSASNIHNNFEIAKFSLSRQINIRLAGDIQNNHNLIMTKINLTIYHTYIFINIYIYTTYIYYPCIIHIMNKKI